MYVCVYVIICMHGSMNEKSKFELSWYGRRNKKLDRYYQGIKQGRILIVLTSHEHIIEIMKCRCRFEPTLTSLGVYFCIKSCEL